MTQLLLKIIQQNWMKWRQTLTYIVWMENGFESIPLVFALPATNYACSAFALIRCVRVGIFGIVTKMVYLFNWMLMKNKFKNTIMRSKYMVLPANEELNKLKWFIENNNITFFGNSWFCVTKAIQFRYYNGMQVARI